LFERIVITASLTIRNQPMTFDAFALVGTKLEQAGKHLEEMGQAIIHPRHKPGFTATHVAMMSCPGTVIAHNWHEPFESQLNAFLAATRSVPDIITKQLGYDMPRTKPPWYSRWLYSMKSWLGGSAWTGNHSWLSSLGEGERKRRKKFQRKFEREFKKFRQFPLSEERHEVIHRSGLAHWQVRVKGRFKTYVGGPMNRLRAVEEFPFISREDPSFWLFADSSPPLVEPMAADFWWVIPQPDGTDKSLPLFDECRTFLRAAGGLETLARQLYQDVHQGQKLTSPPW
jgi:hypothetical protein